MINHGYVRAFSGEREGRGAANPVRGTGDKYGLS
jgi:hypothetical protein